MNPPFRKLRLPDLLLIVLRVPRGDENPDLREESRHLLGKGETVHPGHHQIREEKVRLDTLRPDHPQRLLPSRGRINSVALLRQNLQGEVPYPFVVFDENDHLAPAFALFPSTLHDRLGGFCTGRQVDLEGAPVPVDAVDLDDPVVLPDDGVNDGEPQAGPLSPLLGRKEGLEESLLNLLAHPDPGVAYRKYDVLPGGTAPLQEEVSLLHELLPGPDGDPLLPPLPLLREGVPGVDDQVDQNLLKPGRIDLHRGEGNREPGLKGDVLPDDVSEHLQNVRHHLVDVENLAPGLLLAAEDQQLSDEADGPLSGFVDGPDVAADPLQGLRIFAGTPLQSQLGLSHDHRENVVEIVGDSSGQPPQGIELLGLNQLALQLPSLLLVPDPLGYVRDHRKASLVLALLPVEGRRRDDRRDTLPPLGLPPHLVGFTVTLPPFFQLLFDDLLVLAVEEFHQVSPDKFIEGVSRKFTEPPVHVLNDPIRVDNDKALVHVLDQESVLLLALL